MIDSLADIFASSITFIAVKISSKPADSNHRYGHGKVEAVSALIQSAFVAGSGIFVMYDGFSRMLKPVTIEQTGAGILIMSVSLIATLALIVFQKYVAQRPALRQLLPTALIIRLMSLPIFRSSSR